MYYVLHFDVDRKPGALHKQQYPNPITAHDAIVRDIGNISKMRIYSGYGGDNGHLPPNHRVLYSLHPNGDFPGPDYEIIYAEED